MKVFLSYPRTESNLAADLVARLKSRGHEVFFDAYSLPPSESYDDLIRKQIEEAQRSFQRAIALPVLPCREQVFHRQFSHKQPPGRPYGNQRASRGADMGKWKHRRPGLT